MTTLNLQVGASTDDAHQAGGGGMQLDLSYLLLESGRTGGVRFDGVIIPTGATIDSADPQIYVTSTDYDDPDNTIYGEDGGDPGTFTIDDYNITDRTQTTASVSKSATGVGAGWYSWPESKTIIQEIVDTYGGLSSEALVLLIYDDGATAFRCRSWDYDTGLAFKLDIDYTYTPPAAITTIFPEHGVHAVTFGAQIVR